MTFSICQGQNTPANTDVTTNVLSNQCPIRSQLIHGTDDVMQNKLQYCLFNLIITEKQIKPPEQL